MLHLIQNHPEVPPGLYAAALQERGRPFRIVRPDLGEELPPPGATIVFGGYMGVHDSDRFPFLLRLRRYIRQCLETDVPFFGICLGGQLLAAELGAEVSSNRNGEKGVCRIVVNAAEQNDPFLAGLPAELTVFQWHNDSFAVPAAARPLAASPVCPGQAFRYGRAIGVQFHPEVDAGIVACWSRHNSDRERLQNDFAAAAPGLRQSGLQMLDNFLAGCDL